MTTDSADQKANDMQAAAESYAADRMTLYPLHGIDERQYRLLLEIAFMQGSMWQSEQSQAFLAERLRELEGLR